MNLAEIYRADEAEAQREEMERRLTEWGNWRRKCANNPGLWYQATNLIARMRGEIVQERRDWSAEEEMDFWIQQITLIYPQRGAALLARYAHIHKGARYHQREKQAAEVFARYLTSLDIGTSRASYRQALAAGRASVEGFLIQEALDRVLTC